MVVAGYEEREDIRGWSYIENENYPGGRQTGPSRLPNQVHSTPPHWRSVVSCCQMV